MLIELEQLGMAVGAIRESDARQVVDSCNRRLLSLLNAQFIKVYWTAREAEEGDILDPIAFINQMALPDPQAFTVLPDTRGVFAWAFRNRAPLWLEHLHAQPSDEAVKEQLSGRLIPADELNLPTTDPRADSMLVVPIIERKIVSGLYCIELTFSDRLTRATYRLLDRICRTLAPLLYNADVYRHDLEKTHGAVTKFLHSTRDFKFDPIVVEEAYRTAFVARPFAPEYARTQERIEASLAADGIRAQSYVPEGGRYVIEEIMSQVRNAHFCIADMTGANSNVLAEVGMMMPLRKEVLILRKRGDEAAIPFDLSHHSVWEYDFGAGSQLVVWNPAEGQMTPFASVLQQFVNRLPAESGFFLADRWDPAVAR